MKGEPLGMVQVIKILLHGQMVYVQTKICAKNETHKILPDFLAIIETI